jgi:hypothetical protein
MNCSSLVIRPGRLHFLPRQLGRRKGGAAGAAGAADKAGRLGRRIRRGGWGGAVVQLASLTGYSSSV